MSAAAKCKRRNGFGFFEGADKVTAVFKSRAFGDFRDGQIGICLLYTSLRIHLYEQGESAALQLGRVEIYNSAETERKVRYAESGAFSVSGWITPQDVGIGEMSDTVDFENAMANMAASGINFSLPNIWEGDTLFYRQRLVYTCNKLGMQTLVYDADLIRYLAGASYDEATAWQMVESYASEASFAGHFIMDEPNGEQLLSLIHI